MAREVVIWNKSLLAAADLSASQFCAVKVDTAAKAALPSAGNRVLGIQQGKATAGNVATVMVLGESKMVVGAAGVTQGDALTPDSAGKAVTATTGNYILGTAMQTGVSGDIITVVLCPGGISA